MANPDSRTLAAWAVLSRTHQCIFDFVLVYAVVINVRQPRFGVEVESDLHRIRIGKNDVTVQAALSVGVRREEDLPGDLSESGASRGAQRFVANIANDGLISIMRAVDEP